MFTMLNKILRSYTIRLWNTKSRFTLPKKEKNLRDWLDSLKDVDTQALIFQRLQRIKLGNFGDCKPISEGLWEFRIHHKAGIRIYYARVGQRLILIIGGGDKRSQERDITKAMKYLDDYRRRIL